MKRALTVKRKGPWERKATSNWMDREVPLRRNGAFGDGENLDQ